MDDRSYHGRKSARKSADTPWVRMPADALDELVAFVVARVDGEWPACAVVADLVAHQDKAARPHRQVSFPSRRNLASRWGWSDRKTRTMLADESAWKDPSKILDVPSASQPRPSGVPAASQPRPTENERTPSIMEEASQPRPNDVPSASRPRPNRVHTRVDPQPPSTSTTNSSKEDATADADAHTPRAASDAAVQAHALRVIEEIRQKPVAMGGSVGDRKALTALWKSGGRPDPEAFFDDLVLVAKAFRECPDPLFARDVRAEGWASGTDRHRSVATLCVQSRLDDRIDAATRWRDSGYKSTSTTSVARAAGQPATTSGEAEWDAMAPHLARVAARGLRTTKSPSGALLGNTDDEHARRLAAFEAVGGFVTWQRAENDYQRDQIRKRWIAAWGSR